MGAPRYTMVWGPPHSGRDRGHYGNALGPTTLRGPLYLLSAQAKYVGSHITAKLYLAGAQGGLNPPLYISSLLKVGEENGAPEVENLLH